MIETSRCELTTLQSCDRDLVVKLYTDAEVLKRRSEIYHYRDYELFDDIYLINACYHQLTREKCVYLLKFSFRLK